MSGTGSPAAGTLIPRSASSSPTQVNGQPRGEWDLWHPDRGNRPALSRFAESNLSPDDEEKIRSFFRCRSAYLDMELHPIEHHPADTHTEAARYRNELELDDEISNSRAVLRDELSQLATYQIDCIREFFSRRSMVEMAELLYIRILRFEGLASEDLNEVVDSRAFPPFQRLLERVAEHLARTGEGGREWRLFKDRISMNYPRLRSLSRRARRAEEDALMKWWEIVLARRG